MATMTAAEGRLEIYCDNNSHFYFELTGSGATQRWFSSDPRDFHDYTKALSSRGYRFAWAAPTPTPPPSPADRPHRG